MNQETVPRPAERLLHPCPAPKGSYLLPKRDVKPERTFFCLIVRKHSCKNLVCICLLQENYLIKKGRCEGRSQHSDKFSNRVAIGRAVLQAGQHPIISYPLEH
jgi:hypothetical protein